MLTLANTPEQNQLQEVNSHHSSDIKDELLLQHLTIPLTIKQSATCEHLVQLFKENPENECVVLVDAFFRPIGLFMRNTLFMKFSRRYSSDLFYEKPVQVLIEHDPLILESSTSPEQVIKQALNRHIQTRYDCVVIVNEQQTLQGVLTLSNILELSAELQRLAKYEQQVVIEKATGYVQHIAEQMQIVEHEIVKQQHHFNNMIDFTLLGKNLLQALLDRFEHISTNTNLQYEQIHNMKQDSQQLKTVAHHVIELSEQSNILALNASIEAAKAKEHGLAFNVVASEVRNLSQKTKGSASHIQAAIQTMLALIEQNEHTSKSSVDLTNSSITIVNETEEVFKSIFASLAHHQEELTVISEQAKQVTNLTHKTTSELEMLSHFLN